MHRFQRLLPLFMLLATSTQGQAVRSAGGAEKGLRVEQQTGHVTGPARRFDGWRVLGPGGGGTTISPTVSPHDPHVVVEHCDMTGGYITTDGARSWRMFNLRAGISTFAFDQQHPAVIYAGNAALWRSEDAGRTWSMIFPDPFKGTTEHTWNDHAEYILTTKDESYPASGQEVEIQAIAVDPADSNRLYVVFGSTFATRQPSSLYFSKDRGQSWQRVTEFGREKIHAIYIRPSGAGGSGVVYVLSESGVYEGNDTGWTHRAGPGPDKIEFASAGTVKGTNSPLLYVTTESRWHGETLSGGIYTSADAGQTWLAASVDVLKGVSKAGQDGPPQFQAISCAAQSAATAYVGFRELRLGAGAANLFNGIAKTVDGGKTWTIVHQESNRPSPNLSGSWIEERAPDSYPNIFFDAPYSLGVAPTDPDTCYVTDLFRTYRTNDGGRTWQDVNSVRVGANRWTTRGLDVTTSYGVHFDPFDARHIFITYTDIGLFHSRDAGASWAGATVGIPNTWRNTTYWVEFDPQVRNLMWGAFSATHDLPRPKMWRNRNPDAYEGGVGVSTDGGQHWLVANKGLPQAAVTHIILDPKSPVGRRTLYACAFGRGVYKSTDNGQTWTLKNNGIKQQQPFAWRLTRATDGTLYLVVARRSERGRIGDAGDGALYKSGDGGEHWVEMKLPEGTNGPTSLVLDPADERRMYLTAWGVARLSGDTGGGIFRSDDGGATWRNIFDESQHVYDLTVDPKRPGLLYACGFDAAAYRSTDGGRSWTHIKGYNFKWGHRVVLDPADPDKIYITTFGGSVWHGPAAGDARSVGDIRTPLALTRP
ncbi:MAG: hypothetical protein ACJ74W_07260 [Pyrinomonadaceae bacterium]